MISRPVCLLNSRLKHPGFCYFRSPFNLGVARSWNFGVITGIKDFAADYFLILNNDTLLHPDTIDEMVAELERGEAMLVSATNLSGDLAEPPEILIYKNLLERKLRDCPDFSCFMIGREALEKVGPFDENFYPAYFEDNDYHYRIRLAGGRACGLAEPFIITMAAEPSTY